MVIAGPSFGMAGECAEGAEALLLSEPKLGRLTTLVLPPRTSTPGTTGAPVGALPAPPGPGVGEIPPRVLGSEPTLVPVLPAPDFPPFKPLPGPSPWPMLAPPPAPPTPGLSPPEGDIASEPLLLPGMPTLEPGWAEITMPDPLLLPTSLGGASTEPESPGPPSPEPFLPEPDRPAPIAGGGGTTLPASCVPSPDPPEFPDPVGEPWLAPATDGGGGITFAAPNDDPGFLPLTVAVPDPETEFEPPTVGGGGTTLFAGEPSGAPPRAREVPEVFSEVTAGGGGTTLLASAPDPPLRTVAEAPPAETLGGGGTTSCVPKSLPITVLTKDVLDDVLPEGVGGGGTTACERSVAPLSSRRRSCAESAEGGGATTDGAGKLSFELRALSRSGAETGGGTTAALSICTRDDETSRLMAVGAGAITFVLSAGAERACSRVMRVDAGPI